MYSKRSVIKGDNAIKSQLRDEAETNVRAPLTR